MIKPMTNRQSLTSDWQLIKRYLSYLKPFKWQCFFCFLLIPLISFFHVLQPIFLQKGIDKGLIGVEKKTFYIFASLYGSFIFFEFLCRSFQSYFFQKLGALSVRQVRLDLFKRLLWLPSSYLDKTPHGVLITKVTTDVESLNDSVSSGLITLLSDILVIIGIVFCLFYLSVKLTLVTFLLSPILFSVLYFFKSRLRKWFFRIRTNLGRINGFLQEQLQGIEIVQLFGRQKQNIELFNIKGRKYSSSVLHSIFYDASLFSTIEGLHTFIAIFILFFAYIWDNQTIYSLGVIIAFLDYLQRLFQPLKEISAKVSTLQSAMSALERIFETLDIKNDVLSGESKLVNFDGTISFKNVSFSYPGFESKRVLNKVSFDINPNEVIAVVGPTGSGKTTISKLLLHLYPGFTGSITIGGQSIYDLCLSSFRNVVAAVLQDSYIFDASLRFNINFGDDKIDDDRVLEVLSWVQMSEVLSRLPNGLDSMISPTMISSGEAQLISFARALARNAPFIVLDEATSNVDSINELKIQQVTKRVFEEKTVLVIAHRLSTIKEAHRIIALSNGEIKEVGSHQELIKKNDFYAHLFKMQYADM